MLTLKWPEALSEHIKDQASVSAQDLYIRGIIDLFPDKYDVQDVAAVPWTDEPSSIPNLKFPLVPIMSFNQYYVLVMTGCFKHTKTGHLSCFSLFHTLPIHSICRIP